MTFGELWALENALPCEAAPPGCTWGPWRGGWDGYVMSRTLMVPALREAWRATLSPADLKQPDEIRDMIARTKQLGCIRAATHAIVSALNVTQRP
jgi:hypothetical protein